MMPAQLKVTTMNKETRNLIKVTIPNEKIKFRKTNKLVYDFIGKNFDFRLKFITENAHNNLSLDI
jgi:DNA gyrase/topoisomerase IV subunit B